MRNIIFILCLFISCTSCREKSALENQVMAIHDEVMPQMGKLNKIKRKLSKKLPEASNDSIQNLIMTEVKKLEAAGEGMMEWMAAYQLPSDKTAHIDYLNKEMIRIKKVKTDMINSMDTGQKLLNALDHKNTE